MTTTHYEFFDYSFLVESYIHITCKLESINIKQLEFTFFTIKTNNWVTREATRIMYYYISGIVINDLSRIKKIINISMFKRITNHIIYFISFDS